MKDLRIVNNEQFLDEESMKIILLRLFNIFPSMVNLFWGYKKKEKKTTSLISFWQKPSE